MDQAGGGLEAYMHRRLASALVCALIAWAIAAAGVSADVKDLVPLAVGNRWEYSTYEFGVMTIGGAGDSQSIPTGGPGTYVEEVLSINEQRPNGDVVYLINSVTKTEEGLNSKAAGWTTDTLMLASKDGLFIVADRSWDDSEPPKTEWEKYDPPLVELPNDAAPGRKWKVGTVRNDDLRMPMTAQAAGYETVTVPAGTFENCLKLYTTSGRITGSVGLGDKEATIKRGRSVVIVWLYPGVGMVKETDILQIKMQFPPDESGQSLLVTTTNRRTLELQPGYRAE